MATSTSSTPSSSRIGSTSPSTSVICQEVFDESCLPSQEEISDYAALLGIDPVKETHLLYLAKEGLMQAMPADWKICYSEEKCGHYYYNLKTRKSQWEHPLDDVYRKLVEETRLKLKPQPQQQQLQEAETNKNSAKENTTFAVAAQLPSNTTTATFPVIAAIVDISDDASQLDSGIRSLQVTDECDNTNNTAEMSSPSTTHLTGAIPKQQNTATAVATNNSSSQGSLSNTTSGGTSGFSGGVSKFLESRTKNFNSAFLAAGKNTTRFEVTKTNPQLNLQMRFPTNENLKFPLTPNKAPHCMPLQDGDGSAAEKKQSFTLSGTGAMFLKSRRQLEQGLNHASALMTNPNSVATSPLIANVIVEGMAGTPPGVKGILRDSSLTDMRRRMDKDKEHHDDSTYSWGGGEERKSVRFNLEELSKNRASADEEASASVRKLAAQSPEISANSEVEDDDYCDDAENDDDPWDDDDNDEVPADGGDEEDEDDDDDDGEELNECIGVGSLPLDSIGYQQQQYRNVSNNPFLSNDAAATAAVVIADKHIKEVKVIPVSKTQTIQMLKAQSFSMDLPADREKSISPKDFKRSQSVEQPTTQTSSTAANVVHYLDNLKETAAPTSSNLKAMYDDTDSDSKGSSIRSFIINKSEQDSMHSQGPPVSNNPFDLDELDRRHSHDVEQLEKKLQKTSAEKTQASRSFKVASKLVGFLKKDSDKVQPASDGEQSSKELPKQQWLKEEREHMEKLMQQEIQQIKKEHELKLKSVKHEYDLRLTSRRHEMDEAIELQVEEYRLQLEDELESKRKAIIDEHKTQMLTLQKNHAEILEELERDLKSEEEILRKEHNIRLQDMKDKLSHELELERQKMRDNGDDRMYEKVRCEKRLLEDKYRCLKEKYIRLKTDVKLSLERRNRRREAQAIQQQSLHTTTTGSETERSISNKPSIGNSENRSLSYSTSCQNSVGMSNTGTAGKNGASQNGGGGGVIKPPLPPKTHLHASKEHQHQQQQHHHSERSAERLALQSSRKPGIASKYIKHLQAQDDTTSMSQSDTTISNNYSKGRYLPAPANNSAALSDNGNSDSEAFQSNQENNNNSRGAVGNTAATPQRKKQFSRMKSASTSRLNSDNYKTDRPCTPVENLRHQLQKLEDLEDQFPENTLDATYHLRYPFSDISNNDYAAGTSSELEFFKHRIHLERDSVRRAKESLRTQRTNFRARQREIKQRHKAMVTRHTLDQLIQEEKELTEMEVNLHRTRALLGEKVIRLRHLEQSLLRIYEKEKPPMDLLGVEQKIDDATLSDLSSHSSSGFSSTDFASGDTQNLNKRKDAYQLESNECIKNLEILNAEIREILDILGKGGAAAGPAGVIGVGGNVAAAGGLGASSLMGQQHGGLSAAILPTADLNWSHMLNAAGGTTVPTQAATGNINLNLQTQQQQQQQFNTTTLQHSIPTLADRLETYRQLASGRMQNSMMAANTIVSQNPRALSYTTSLVERTRDLRNWLRQAKNEHELLSSMTLGLTGQQMSQAGAAAGGAAGMLTAANMNSGNIMTGAAQTISGAGAGAGGGTQTNL